MYIFIVSHNFLEWFCTVPLLFMFLCVAMYKSEMLVFDKPTYLCLYAVLQIRRGNRDNLGIISHIFPEKHIL